MNYFYNYHNYAKRLISNSFLTRLLMKEWFPCWKKHNPSCHRQIFLVFNWKLCATSSLWRQPRETGGSHQWCCVSWILYSKNKTGMFWKESTTYWAWNGLLNTATFRLKLEILPCGNLKLSQFFNPLKYNQILLGICQMVSMKVLAGSWFLHHIGLQVTVADLTLISWFKERAENPQVPEWSWEPTG